MTKTFWVGEHLKYGLLVYERKKSIVDRPDTVRLFIVNDGRWGYFSKEIVRKKFKKDSELARIFSGKYAQKLVDACRNGYSVSVEAPDFVESTYSACDWNPGFYGQSPCVRAYDPMTGQYGVKI